MLKNFPIMLDTTRLQPREWSLCATAASEYSEEMLSYISFSIKKFILKDTARYVSQPHVLLWLESGSISITVRFPRELFLTPHCKLQGYLALQSSIHRVIGREIALRGLRLIDAFRGRVELHRIWRWPGLIFPRTAHFEGSAIAPPIIPPIE